MIKKHFTEKVLANELIAQNTYLMRLTCTEDFLRIYRPGQFAHIEIPHAKDLLLRRPISINYVDFEKKEVHLAYNAVGKGTRLLSLVRAGDMLDVLMPLGNGFQLAGDMKRVWLVGGGIGIAPLKSLYCKYPDREYTAFWDIAAGNACTRHMTLNCLPKHILQPTTAAIVSVVFAPTYCVQSLKKAGRRM